MLGRLAKEEATRMTLLGKAKTAAEVKGIFGKRLHAAEEENKRI